jgi:hypothetical protein
LHVPVNGAQAGATLDSRSDPAENRNVLSSRSGMTRPRFDLARRIVAWTVLAITLIATPGPVAACNCARTTSALRCMHCGPAGTSDASARIERPSCCSSRATTGVPAVVATTVQIERAASATPLSFIATSVGAVPGPIADAGRAPPLEAAAHAPPATRLGTILRL